MILIELQYWGTIQYYTKFLKSAICIEQHENYRKGSFRNRCCIATANGVIELSIPLLKGKHQQAPIRSIEIDNSTHWQSIHWKSIQTAYGSSPFFEYYQDDLQRVYQKKYHLLFDFCLDLQELVLKWLQIRPNIVFSTEFVKEVSAPVIDCRNKILPKNYQQNNDPLFHAMPYPQVFEDRYGFLPNLSILDLLFCTGSEAVFYLK